MGSDFSVLEWNPEVVRVGVGLILENNKMECSCQAGHYIIVVIGDDIDVAEQDQLVMNWWHTGHADGLFRNTPG
ncbi:hypothetical protein HYQ46_004989 [Verticillium longisporum]|nr:hypothetical protein HYQ46_004989 [Verticillium longisporum]